MEQAPVLDHIHAAPDAVASSRPAASPSADPPPPVRRNARKARQFWMKQLHGWHWVSAAMSLVGMLLFAITGITLNHAASISAAPETTLRESVLPAPLLAEIRAKPAADNAPLPPAVADGVRAMAGLDPRDRPAEWTDEEVYVALPGPGRDAWISIDRASGAVTAERTDRGLVSYLNDLHKGRNTGDAWFWFIDLFAIACIIFTITGLLLLQLHARHRPSTWPLVALGTAIPVIIAVIFIH